jgi:hypothetical protein
MRRAILCLCARRFMIALSLSCFCFHVYVCLVKLRYEPAMREGPRLYCIGGLRSSSSSVSLFLVWLWCIMGSNTRSRRYKKKNKRKIELFSWSVFSDILMHGLSLAI